MNKIKSKLIPFIKENKYYVIFCACLFVILTVLFSLVPLSGDDWDWGSDLANEQLSTWFDSYNGKGYNGRYAGNLLVIVLTRVAPLRSVFKAGCMTALCIMPLLFLKKKSMVLLSFSTALTLMLSRRAFVQGIFWTAGFVNYVTPILLTFIYFLMVNNIFEKDSPVYDKKKNIVYSVITLLIGFISVMFLENVAIYILGVSALIIVYAFIKWKKVFFPHLAHLLGSILGTIAMFSNKAYRNIANGEDQFGRNMFSNIKNLYMNIVGKMHQTIDIMLIQSFLPLVISSMCIAITVFKIVKKEKKNSIILSVATLFNILATLIFYSKKSMTIWLNVTCKIIPEPAITLLIACIFYCASLFAVSIVCTKDREKIARMVLFIAGVPLLVAPMLVVTTFGPRCVVPPYICIVFFCVFVFDSVWEEFGIKGKFNIIPFAVLTAISIAFLSYYTVIYAQMDVYQNKRLEYIEKQIDCGYATLTVPDLPYLNYMQNGSLKTRWARQFKNYYDIDQSHPFRVLSPKDFDAWARSFDAQH